MEDLNVAIEMAKKSTEKSEMLLENSVCNRSNSECCSCPSESSTCAVLSAFPFVSLMTEMTDFCSSYDDGELIELWF